MNEVDISFEVCRPIESNAHLVMKWRNDPDTRQTSFHREEKQWATFWPEFTSSYFNGPVQSIFARHEETRVAFLKFNSHPHPKSLAGRTVEISINVSPNFRGQGLGSRILQSALDHLAEAGVDSVYAEVRAENAQSLKTFAAAGFEDLGEHEKRVDDTGEACRIHKFIAELTPAFWRRGHVYVVAEAGSNWRMGTTKRDTAMARALIEAAAGAGADAVKFQTYRPETVYVANAGGSDYLAAAGIKEDIREIFADLAMPYELLGELADYCREHNVDFMSTGFSVQDLEAIDPFVTVHKIASYEISHPRLIDFVARTNKPVLMSTGASTMEDIAWAVERFRTAKGGDLCLLQCTAKYPAPLNALNVSAIPTLQRRFRAAAGLSDHSREPSIAAVAAVALGARAIEKHFTLDNRLPGPDHAFAVTPTELSRMTSEVRLAEKSLGDGVKRVLAAEEELARYARRGVQATKDIAPGDVLCEGQNFDILRPGQQSLGAHPRHLGLIDGRKARRPILEGHGIAPSDVEET